MKVLCIGDVVSRVGRDMLFEYVDELKYQKGIDFVIVNGENASHGNGMNKNAYDELLRAGCDMVTMGNHTWGNLQEIRDIMGHGGNVIRPMNYSGDCPGEGYSIMTAKNGAKIGVINLIGRTFMKQPYESPFFYADKAIEEIKKSTNIILVDFHAEATSEKEALGFYLDGRVSAVFGTHTHVQTADDTILTKGTGYISDLGMTGVYLSVLGMDPDTIVSRFLNGMPNKSKLAEGKGQFNGCIFEIDDATGQCTGTERVFIRKK